MWIKSQNGGQGRKIKIFFFFSSKQNIYLNLTITALPYNILHVYGKNLNIQLWKKLEPH